MPYWATYVAAGIFVVLLLAAAVSDTLRRRIPNWVVLGLVGLYVVAAFGHVAPTGPWSALIAAVIALPITYLLYHFGILGAGDAKLFTAAALFTGREYLMQYAIITALIGGLLAIGYLIARPRRAMRGLTTAGRAEGAGLGLPYGIPIALGAVSACLLNGFIYFS